MEQARQAREDGIVRAGVTFAREGAGGGARWGGVTTGRDEEA